MKTTKSKAAPLLSLALASVVFSGSSSAQESTADVIKKHAPQGITSTFYACVNQAASNAVAAGACLSAEQDVQDKRLNAVYKKLLSALSEKDRPFLIAAERAWIASRDKDRALETVVYGDEQVDNLQQAQNNVFRICERANTLERYLNLDQRYGARINR
jgi:uncharacterized protein YecT (DUF1311 family)